MSTGAATVGTIFGSFAVATVLPIDNGFYIFGFVLMNQLMGNYIRRMAGAYMFSINTL